VLLALHAALRPKLRDDLQQAATTLRDIELIGMKA